MVMKTGISSVAMDLSQRSGKNETNSLARARINYYKKYEQI